MIQEYSEDKVQDEGIRVVPLFSNNEVKLSSSVLKRMVPQQFPTLTNNND